MEASCLVPGDQDICHWVGRWEMLSKPYEVWWFVTILLGHSQSFYFTAPFSPFHHLSSLFLFHLKYVLCVNARFVNGSETISWAFKTGQTPVIGYVLVREKCKCKRYDIMRVMRFMTLIENVNHLYLLNSNSETVNSPSLLRSLSAFLAVCAPTFTVFATSITGLP